MPKTVSLDTAKLLKENGFRQDTAFFAFTESGMLGIPGDWEFISIPFCFAPTSDELLAELPKSWNGFILRIQWELLSKKEGQWHVAYWELGYEDETRGESFAGQDIAELLSKMWLHLKKEGLIKEDAK